MQIIAHRGLWKDASQKNTRGAFLAAFKSKFGAEIDLRDRNSKIVVSHNMADETSFALSELLSQYQEIGNQNLLAFNIKADGLQDELKSLLKQYEVSSYFVFDASVPDGLKYAEKGINFFTRHSDFEPEPSLLERAQGVWLDCLRGSEPNLEKARSFLKLKKDVCIVSQELHGRKHDAFWKSCLKLQEEKLTGKLSLCTDLPNEAMEFFNG